MPPGLRCSAGPYRMLPTSITRCAGSIRISVAWPSASPLDVSRIAKASGSSAAAMVSSWRRNAASSGGGGGNR